MNNKYSFFARFVVIGMIIISGCVRNNTSVISPSGYEATSQKGPTLTTTPKASFSTLVHETILPNGVIVREGVIPLIALLDFPPHSPASFIDLDTASMNDFDESDIEFIADYGTGLYYTLLPVNGAVGRPMGEIEPDYDGCTKNKNSYTNGSIPEITIGSFICIFTNSHRFSQIKVISFEEGKVTISFITWESNED